MQKRTNQYRMTALSLGIMAALGSGNVFAAPPNATDGFGDATSLNAGNATPTTVGNITGITTINGAKNSITGDVNTIIGTNNVLIGTSTIIGTFSTSGLATLDSANVTNNLAVNGNTTLGNAPTDTTTISGATTVGGTWA